MIRIQKLKHCLLMRSPPVRGLVVHPVLTRLRLAGMLFFRLGPYRELQPCMSVKAVIDSDARLSKAARALESAQMTGQLPCPAACCVLSRANRVLTYHHLHITQNSY